MSGTEKTPSLPDIDTTFLTNIFDYSSKSVTRYPMAGFKQDWAERFFGDPEGNKEAVIQDWEFTIALGRNLPVYLTDESGDPRWIFPPIVGELSSNATANIRSLDSMNREIKLIRDRFVAQGIHAEEQMLASLKPRSSNREVINLHIFMIRRECGYLTHEEEKMVQKALGGVKGNVDIKSDSIGDVNATEEYDYD